MFKEETVFTSTQNGCQKCSHHIRSSGELRVAMNWLWKKEKLTAYDGTKRIYRLQRWDSQEIILVDEKEEGVSIVAEYYDGLLEQ